MAIDDTNRRTRRDLTMAKTAPRETFADILDTPSEDVSRPKPTPAGTYLTMVKGLYREDKSPKKGTEFSEYTLQLLKAMDDVDEEALEEFLTRSNGEVSKLQDRSLTLQCYHTPDALWRLKKFLTDLGIPEREGTTKLSLRDRMQMVPGRQVLVHVKHSPSQDGEAMFAQIDRTAKVTDED